MLQWRIFAVFLTIHIGLLHFYCNYLSLYLLRDVTQGYSRKNANRPLRPGGNQDTIICKHSYQANFYVTSTQSLRYQLSLRTSNVYFFLDLSFKPIMCLMFSIFSFNAPPYLCIVLSTSSSAALHGCGHSL